MAVGIKKVEQLPKPVSPNWNSEGVTNCPYTIGLYNLLRYMFFWLLSIFHFNFFSMSKWVFLLFVVVFSLLCTRQCKTKIWGQCWNPTFRLLSQVCDTVRWPILWSARVESCILRSGDKTRGLGPDKIAGVDKNLPDVLIRKWPSLILQIPSLQVV